MVNNPDTPSPVFGSQRMGERPSAPVLVFDIETVPDVPLMFAGYEPRLPDGRGFSRDQDWANLSIVNLIREQKQVTFPPPMYHVVMCICAVFVHPETHTIIDGFKRTLPVCSSYEQLLAAEAGLLREFWSFCTKHADAARVWYDQVQTDFRMSDYQRKKLKPLPVTFCGYNISGFDLPVIEQRSMKHFIPCPIPEYGREFGYDSYRSRFAFDKSFDLAQFVNGNASQKIGLDILAQSMGLAGKLEGMDGSQVADAYYSQGATQKIEDYCAVDVLITYGVYLGVQRFRGILDQEHFADCARQFEKFLMHETRPLPYRILAEQSAEFFKKSRL
ncbi:MAG: ribonuclease H-like domain-containing protein [Silvanigrellaceae bacterium]